MEKMSKAEVTTVKSHKEIAKKRSKNDPSREPAKEQLTIPTKDLVARVKIDVEEGYPNACIIYRYDENTSAWSIGEMNSDDTVFVEVKPFFLKAIMAKLPLSAIVECQNRKEDWNDPSSVIIPDTKLWNMLCSNKHSIPDWLIEAKNFKQFMDIMEKEWKRRNPQDNFTINTGLLLESKRAPCVPPPYYLPRKSAPEEKDDGFVVPDDKIEVVEREKDEEVHLIEESSSEEVVEVKPPAPQEKKKNKAPPGQETPAPKRQKVEEPPPVQPLPTPPAVKPTPFAELCTNTYDYFPLTKGHNTLKAAAHVEPHFGEPAQLVKFIQFNESDKLRVPTLARLVCLLEAIAFRKGYPDSLKMKLPGLSSVEINVSLEVRTTRELPATLRNHVKHIEDMIAAIEERILQETKIYNTFVEISGKRGIVRCLLEMFHFNRLKFNWLLYLTCSALGFPEKRTFRDMLSDHKITAEIPSIHKQVKKTHKEVKKSIKKTAKK
jgi:hypothetical protein